MTHLKFAALAVALSAPALIGHLSPAAAQAKAELVPVTLTTGFIFQGSASPLFLAEAKGYFEQGGVKINIVRGHGSADVITKVASGTYQAGTGYLPELVRAKAANPDLDAIAVVISYDAVPDALTGLTKSGIKTPKDIEGKRIVTQPNSTSRITFPLFARAVGVDPGTIKWTEVSGDLMFTPVVRGDADMVAAFGAGAVANLTRIGASDKDIVQFQYGQHVSNLYGNGLIVMKSWADKHPDAVRGLVNAYVRGLIEANADKPAAIQALVTREPLLKANVELGEFEIAAKNYYFTKNVNDKGVAYHTSEDVRLFIENLAGPFQLKRKPAVAEIYTDKYLPPASRRVVNR
jgi:NitT/TauT family transport system substrate-binding protein